jgi:hypothetical protein
MLSACAGRALERAGWELEIVDDKGNGSRLSGWDLGYGRARVSEDEMLTSSIRSRDSWVRRSCNGRKKASCPRGRRQFGSTEQSTIAQRLGSG